MQGSVVWFGPSAGCLPPWHFYKGASAVEDGTGSSLEKEDTGPAVWGEDSLTQAALGGGSEPVQRPGNPRSRP